MLTQDFFYMPDAFPVAEPNSIKALENVGLAGEARRRLTDSLACTGV